MYVHDDTRNPSVVDIRAIYTRTANDVYKAHHEHASQLVRLCLPVFTLTTSLYSLSVEWSHAV